MNTVQARFASIRHAVDQELPGIQVFSQNHLTEAYKGLLKAFSLVDEEIVTAVIAECRTEFNGEPILVYPMLHLPQDTNEFGTWHRDGEAWTQRVFWLPMTAYDYPGISYVAATGGVLSPISSTILTRFRNIGPLEQPITVKSGTFYSWGPRLTHRGNLNVSKNLSAAMVVFMDPVATVTPPVLAKLTTGDITNATRAVLSSIDFDAGGMVRGYDRSKLRSSVPARFFEAFESMFALRTKLDLATLPGIKPQQAVA